MFHQTSDRNAVTWIFPVTDSSFWPQRLPNKSAQRFRKVTSSKRSAFTAQESCAFSSCEFSFLKKTTLYFLVTMSVPTVCSGTPTQPMHFTTKPRKVTLHFGVVLTGSGLTLSDRAPSSIKRAAFVRACAHPKQTWLFKELSRKNFVCTHTCIDALQKAQGATSGVDFVAIRQGVNECESEASRTLEALLPRGREFSARSRRKKKSTLRAPRMELLVHDNICSIVLGPD